MITANAPRTIDALRLRNVRGHPDLPRYAVNLPLSSTGGDVEAMAMYAGQGVGAIDAVEPAAAIVERFAAALRPT